LVEKFGLDTNLSVSLTRTKVEERTSDNDEDGQIDVGQSQVRLDKEEDTMLSSKRRKKSNIWSFFIPPQFK
jgi:hypothetical protein